LKLHLVLGAALLASPVCAQSSPPATHAWPQEPTSFLGIKFGQALVASVINCPSHTEYGNTIYDWPGFGRPCFAPAAGFYQVYNVAPFFDIMVTEIDGKVECVSAKFNNGNAPSLATVDANGIAAALIDKFGPPHYEGAETVQNNAGATFENHVLRWKGTNAQIEFDSVSGEYNHGSVLAYTQIFAAYAEAQQKKGKDAVKGVF
jgi:hypothetical protein